MAGKELRDKTRFDFQEAIDFLLKIEREKNECKAALPENLD